MKIRYIILFLIIFFSKGLQAQNVTIPDPIFKNHMVSICDTSGDNEIQLGEAAIATYIDIDNMNITNLTGITAFTNITTLTCRNNLLTNINISANLSLVWLICAGNQISNLDISANINLQYLYCDTNQLTSLDVSANNALIWLVCSGNQISNLNVSSISGLQHLWCNNNQLTSLDVSGNSTLLELKCENNQLSNVDVSGNNSLSYLRCDNNQITNLDVSGNNSLSYLRCDNNEITSLDVSLNLALQFLNCRNNNLLEINVEGNILLNILACENNQLTSLNVKNGNNFNFTFFGASNNPNLYCIQVDDTTYSIANWTNIDPWANFNIECPLFISGNVKDVEADLTNGSLLLNNCGGCLVQLYEGTNLLSSQNTTADGQFLFVGFVGSNYSVVASKTNGTNTSKVTHNNVNPGDLLTDIKIPFTLVSQTNEVINSLESRTFTTNLFYDLVNANVPANGYNETSPSNFSSTCENITSDYDDIVNSLSRLLIAQKALEEFSDDAAKMIAQTVVSTFDFGDAIISLATFNKKLNHTLYDEFELIKIAKKHAITLAIEGIKKVVLYSWGYLDDSDLSAQSKAKFQGIMDQLKDDADGISDNVALNILLAKGKSIIASQASPFLYENVFIPKTASNVSLASTNASSNSYSGSFESTFENIIHNSSNSSMVDIAHQKTLDDSLEIVFLRNASQITSAAAEIALLSSLVSSAFDGGTMASLSAILTGMSFGSSGLSLATSISRINEIINELPAATSGSFLGQNYPRAPFMVQELESRSLELATAISDYNDHLLAIQNNINAGERDEAIAKIETLLILDSLLQEAQMNALLPIYAAAPFANNEISNFDSLYNYSIINSSCQSMFKRQAVIYNLIGYLMDSSGLSVLNSFNESVSLTINMNDQMSSDIEDMNESITTILVPAHIFVTSQNVPKPMASSTEYPVTFSYKNLGTVDAVEVYAKLTLRDGFTTFEDSIYIGAVATNGTGTVTFNIQSPSMDTTSYLTVIFYSPNTTSDGIGTSLVVNSTLSIPEIKYPLEEKFTIFPNPFKSQTTVLFSEEQKNTIVKIIDIQGKEVRKLRFSGKELKIEKGSMREGIYILQLIDKRNNITNTRIFVQ